MLNKKRIKRTDEELALEAIKYFRRVDFQQKSNAYYKQACIDRCFSFLRGENEKQVA